MGWHECLLSIFIVKGECLHTKRKTIGSSKKTQDRSSLNQKSSFFSKYPAITIALGAAKKMSSVTILISEKSTINTETTTEKITKR